MAGSDSVNRRRTCWLKMEGQSINDGLSARPVRRDHLNRGITS
jgi:hypothetical protein